jgi:hypothetical protein
VFRAHGDDVGVIQAVGNLGGLELQHGGDAARGLQMTDEAIAMAHDVGWSWWEARALVSTAEWLGRHGDPESAARRARAALEIFWPAENLQESVLALAILARAAAAAGDDARALALWSAVEAADDGPSRFGTFDRDEYRASMPAGPRPEPLTLEDAVALALS